MGVMNAATTQRLDTLADSVRTHFEMIEQDVPDESYLVGGAVRDALLDDVPNDLDFVVVGETPESMRERGFEDLEASSFPVFHDSANEEWALARTEQKDGVGYDGFSVLTNNVSLQDDLERRDLRCNAMALAVEDNSQRKPPKWFHNVAVVADDESWGLIDPFDGSDDIDAQVLRHISPAFADDPLRILRVARFAGRLEFDVAPETIELMRSVVPEVNRMSRDRIGSELVKAMAQAASPSRVIDVLRRSGALAVLWPELDRATLIPAGPQEHHAEGSVAEHTDMVLENMHELCETHDITGHDRVRRLWMALAHDIGKCIIADRKGGIHSDDPPTRFPNHASIGAESMDEVGRRLGLPGEIVAVMEDAAELHMSFYDLQSMSVREMRKFLQGHFPAGIESDGMQELPTNDAGEPHAFFGATAWEMLDLIQADHEGRLRLDESGKTRRPELDRQQFADRIAAVFEATQSVDGFEALETGLCDEHDPEQHDAVVINRNYGTIECDGTERAVQTQMERCDRCRTPDEWVGTKLDTMIENEIAEQLWGDAE